MKKTLFFLMVALLGLGACDKQPDTLRLICEHREPVDIPQRVEFYEVNINFNDKVAVVSGKGEEYELQQQYDAPVAFYRTEPWYNLQIGNREFSNKYTLGISMNDSVVYIPCHEADEIK